MFLKELMGINQNDRIEVTIAEIAHLTLGSWSNMTVDSEIAGCYCGDCDDVDAVLVVRDYYLSLKNNGVVTDGICKSCGGELLCTYGILDRQLIQDVLTMTVRSK